MVNRVMTMALGTVMGQLLKQRIRNGSLQAVKNYIQLVKAARMTAIALVAISAAGSVLVAGLLLIVVGLVGLLPIDPNTVAIVILSMGVLLSLAAVVGFAVVFSEKRWLEVSKAYELMDAALGPWDGVLPPNPVDILKGPKLDPQVAAVSSEVREVTAEPLLDFRRDFGPAIAT